MSLLQHCHKAVLIASVFPLLPAQAVTLNFSAELTNGTCTLSLDNSVLSLGDIVLKQLRPTQLVSAKPFTLKVQSCNGMDGGNTKPVVIISGNGVTQDNKWLFRNAGSATGVGILVFRSDTLPVYTAAEVKNNSVLSLGNAGHNPPDQDFSFYAGASCGGSVGCSRLSTGNVTASLVFTLTYQ